MSRKCRHKWKDRPLWDMFSKHHKRCELCGWWKRLVLMRCRDGIARPRWEVRARP